MPAQTSQMLRADARENRSRVLEAAREMFARRGIDVPMSTIARHAGVGVATLYRRFPTREALVTEVFTDELAACSGVVDDALADPDPWHGFSRMIEKVCTAQATDRGFTEAFLTAFPDAIDFERVRQRAEQGFAEVVRRAKASGDLRADFHPSDLTMVLLANCGVTTSIDPATALATSRRLVAYFLRAFRAGSPDEDAPLPPPAPLGLDQLPR
ncbi:TetR/AcrR family transcriptional regulator [Amycolatopsis sp. NBC_00345]|uniref:TetR/AcrR family transcriptional regulator n=1 Tax=Amycolatopsis sp. NBC_00345 TaxID=2975955 RepID=UPI002E265C3D